MKKKLLVAAFIAAIGATVASCGGHGGGAGSTSSSTQATGEVPTVSGYAVCDQTNLAIHVAIAYRAVHPDGYIAQGWTDVAPSHCEHVLQGVELPERKYYVYAYISNDKTTNNRDWGGYDYFCLSWSASFKNEHAKDNAECTRTETQNEEWVGFYAVDTAQGDGSTTISY